MYGRNERRRAESNTVEKCSKALQIKRRERWSDGVMGSPITPQPHYSNTPVVREGIMSQTIKALVAVLLWSVTEGRVEAQPILKMGYSGAGVAQSLYNTVDKAGLWNK